jgi:hypothetical protein
LNSTPKILNYINLIILLTILTFFFDFFNVFLIYIVIPFSFLIIAINNLKIFKNTYIILFLMLLIWSTISALFVGIDSSSSIKVLRSMLLTFFFGFQVVALSSKKDKNIFLFYKLFFYFLLANLYVAFFRYDLSSANVFDNGFRDDLEVFKNINANRFGYFLLFLTFVVFILGEKVINNKFLFFFKIVFILSIFVIIIMSLYTGSRQILILNIPLYLILIYLRYNKLIGNKIIGTFILFFLTFIFGIYINSIIQGSEVGIRFKSEKVEDDARSKVIYEAISMGSENLIFGVGPGHLEYKLGMISHNSYTEIFAETGILGLVIYILLLFYSIYEQYKRYKITHDKIFLYFGIYLFFYILNNLFYVFYSWYLLFAIFFLVVIHSKKYYDRNYLFC